MLIVNPLVAPIWLGGLFAFLFWRPLRPYRVLGWSYLVTYSVIFFQHGKNYYLAPIYPMLMAAGAVIIESVIEGRKLEQSKLEQTKLEQIERSNNRSSTPHLPPVPDGPG